VCSNGVIDHAKLSLPAPPVLSAFSITQAKTHRYQKDKAPSTLGRRFLGFGKMGQVRGVVNGPEAG